MTSEEIDAAAITYPAECPVPRGSTVRAWGGDMSEPLVGEYVGYRATLHAPHLVHVVTPSGGCDLSAQYVALGEPGLGEPRVFGIKDGQALVRFPNGETTVIPEIDVSGPVPKVVTWKSMHAIDGSWVACSTPGRAEAHQQLFLPEARGGVEQVSCPAGTSWSHEGGLVGPDGSRVTEDIDLTEDMITLLGHRSRRGDAHAGLAASALMTRDAQRRAGQPLTPVGDVEQAAVLLAAIDIVKGGR